MDRSLSLGVLLFALPALAQEQLGIANSNYAGTDAVALNPARLSGQWPWMDIRVLGVDAFVWNDHVFLGRNAHSFWGDVRGGLNGTLGDFTVNSSLAPGKREAFVSAAVHGPAIAMSMGKSSFGAHISTRLATSAVGISAELARFLVNGLGYGPQQGIRYEDGNVRISSAAWTEAGISYARILYSHGYQLITAGATVDYLMGHHGMAVRFDKLDYTVIDSMQLRIHQATGRYAFAEPGLQNGSGLGFDVGMQYIRTLSETDRYLPHRASTGCDPLLYRWRAGLSLIDLGAISYSRPYTGSFTAAEAYFPDYTAIDVSDVEGADSLLRSNFTRSTTDPRMRIGLPTALSAQVDVNVAPNVYIAADLVQNVAPVSSLRLRRPNSLGIVPRFETKRFEVALPVVLREYDLRKPSVGLMVRLNNIVVGSDHVLPMLARTDIYGLDLYVRVKWTIFKGPYCNGKKQLQHSPGDRNALPCTAPPTG